MWKTKNYLAMRTDFQDEAAAQLITSDLTDLAVAANNLAHHVSGSGISVLRIIASIAAMYVI
jgi:hypothetical protein